jgi:hypothetical protein
MKNQVKYVRDFNMLLLGLFLIMMGLSILCWNTIVTDETKTYLHALLLEGAGKQFIEIKSGSLFDTLISYLSSKN